MGAYRNPVPRMPACPSCGSRDKVIQVATSPTPFEYPNMRDPFVEGRYYCQLCSHDFEPEHEDE